MNDAGGPGMFGDIGVSSDLLFFIGFLSLMPFVIIAATSFIKIAVVFLLVRNALGIQQIPPNMVIYGLAITITIYIMLPVGSDIYTIVRASEASGVGVAEYLPAAAEPLSGFLERNADPLHKRFFEKSADRFWPAELDVPHEARRFLTLLPSFMITELSEAFTIGFLIYLPFIAIDIVVSNILLALGMMMVSPVTISLPFKLFLFVAVDGWTRLVKGLLMSYGTG